LLRSETVLVLPFFNQSNAENVDWIGESIAENIRESLTGAGVLALDREERLEAFRRLSLRSNAVLTRASIIKAGESLDAADVVFGQYELEETASAAGGAVHGTLRITAHVLDLKRLKRGPEFTEAGELTDLAEIEARVSWEALHFLAPKTAPGAEDFLRTQPHVRLDARENYIRGLLAANPEQQRRFFLQAVRLDDSYSQPCFQLGKSFWSRKDYRTAATWLARVKSSDPHYLEAQFYLGLCSYETGDYATAEKCFAAVAASVPLNEVYNDLGASQARRAGAEAIESFRKAVEGDDGDPDYHFNLACALWKDGQFRAAANSLHAALERNPSDTEAAALLTKIERQDPAPAGSEARERLKTNYEETAFRQLKAELESKKD
jgi:tetratricopeptide (TPR) repeat protein